MAEHVIELHLGVDRERYYLTNTDKGLGVTPQYRNAVKFDCRTTAVVQQERLLILPPKEMLKLIRKESPYDIPVAITMVCDDQKALPTNRRRKLYTFKQQD